MPPPELPARAALRGDRLFFEMHAIAPAELREPFLQQTVQRVAAAPALLQIERDELPATAAAMAPGAAPAGIVFHVGRCGSTLVSQMLRQVPGLRVYSEPLAVNEILVPPHAWDRAGRVAALRATAELFAQHAGAPYVIKLSSWNTLYAGLVAEAFPSVPWAFVVRHPLEVCVSLCQRPPGWLRDGRGARLFADLVAADGARDERDDDEAFVARLFAAYCRAVTALDAGRGLVLPYDDLAQAVATRLAPHFGLTLDEATLQRVMAASQRDAKAPPDTDAAFAPDGGRKRAAASDRLREAVQRLAEPDWRRLGG